MAEATGLWDVAKEALSHADTVIWAAVAVWVIHRFGPTIEKLFRERLKSFKAGGVEMEFVRETMDEAATEASHHSEVVISSTLKKKVEISERAREVAAARAVRCRAVLQDKLVLWVDDGLANNRLERKLLQSFGLVIEQVQTNEQAMAVISPADHGYDLILSDIARPPDHPSGLDLLAKLNEQTRRPPLIFYITQVDVRKPVPVGAFGLTNRPDELLHLVIDALERSRKPVK